MGKWKRWTEDDDSLLVQLNKEKSRKEIARFFDVSVGAVNRRLKKLGIDNYCGFGYWTEEEIGLLKRHFPNSTKDVIVKKIKRPWTAIRVKAVKMGIRRESRYKMPEGTNHYFFDSWSPEMAYILGFIAADGNIKKSGMGIGIKLAKKDEELLIKIRNLVCPGRKIYQITEKKTERKYVSLDIMSKYMCQRVMSLGIPPKKSLVLRFPYVPGEFKVDFIRGYFDGDGSVSVYDKYAQSYILGTMDFLLEARETIYNQAGIDRKNILTVYPDKLYRFKFSTYDTIKLGRWMYKDSTIHLERKYNKFKELFKERS